jgi:hypothetical protein
MLGFYEGMKNERMTFVQSEIRASLLEEGLREVTVNHPPSPLQRGKTKISL